jgi:hypothetical protein
MLEYLYLLTFFSWIPLALLASAQTDRPRAARFLWTLSALTFLLCGYLLYLQFIWSKTVVAPIRVDLLLLIPLGTITFAAVGVWGIRKPGVLTQVASVLLLAFSMPTFAVFARGMWKTGRDLARLNERPSLVFEAQFRNPQTFRRFFGNVDKPDDPRVGHFRAEAAGSPVSRVIVNDQGHWWVMLKCGASVECVQLQADIADTRLPGRFRATAEAGPPRDVVIPAWTADRFSLTLPPGGTYTLVRAPVPYRDASPAPATVTFHGALSQTRIDRNYVSLVQVWLWQAGDRWLAYYVRRIASCGSTNDFVFASAYEGKPLADRIYFTQATGARALEEFHLQTPPPAFDGIEGEIVYNGRPLQAMSLSRRSILRSPLYESAPLADFDATARWLKTVSMGYTLPWTADCNTSRSR